MTLHKLLLSFATLFAALSAQAAKVSIWGCAPDYANKAIVVSSYADYVCRLRHDLLTFQVAPDGSFEADVDIPEVTYAFMELGAYNAYIYLEPGARYQVVLPPFNPKADADRFNPFYKPDKIELGIIGASSNLNMAIRDFEAFFHRTLATNAFRLVRNRDKALADKLIAHADSLARVSGCDKAFFKNHVRYRQAQFYAAPRMNALRAIINKFYLQSPVLFNLPAYWETLAMLSPDLFADHAKPALSKRLSNELAKDSTSFANLSAIAASDTLWAQNANLREALLLKSVHDGFYRKDITEDLSDRLLITAAAQCKAKRNKLIAANIYAKKNKLKAGLPAPELDLVDKNDRPVNLADHHGRFLYLCFMHTENYECMKAMPALENLAQVHRQDLDVLCVFTNENAKDAYDYVSANAFSWQAVSFIANQKLVFDYEVQGLPTYFLIAPDGCIAIAQAPGPTEKVGPAIASAIRDYKITLARGRKEVPRTIYDIANGK